MDKHDPNAEADEHVTAEPELVDETADPKAEADEEPEHADETAGAIDRLARGERRCSVPREIVDAVDELRQIIARADALASTTDEQFANVVVLREGDDPRGFKRLAHMVELTSLMVADAAAASDKLFDAIEQTLPAEQR